MKRSNKNLNTLRGQVSEQPSHVRIVPKPSEGGLENCGSNVDDTEIIFIPADEEQPDGNSSIIDITAIISEKLEREGSAPRTRRSVPEVARAIGQYLQDALHVVVDLSRPIPTDTHTDKERDTR